MPLIEYKCPLQHVTERLLTRSQADSPAHDIIHCEYHMPGKRRKSGDPFLCGFIARRVEISQCGSPILKRGCGGFDKPSD